MHFVYACVLICFLLYIVPKRYFFYLVFTTHLIKAVSYPSDMGLKISFAKNALDLQKCLDTTLTNLNSSWRSSQIWILLVYKKTF